MQDRAPDKRKKKSQKITFFSLGLFLFLCWCFFALIYCLRNRKVLSQYQVFLSESFGTQNRDSIIDVSFFSLKKIRHFNYILCHFSFLFLASPMMFPMVFIFTDPWVVELELCLTSWLNAMRTFLSVLLFQHHLEPSTCPPVPTPLPLEPVSLPSCPTTSTTRTCLSALLSNHHH